MKTRARRQAGRLYEIPCLIAFACMVAAIVIPPLVNAVRRGRTGPGAAPVTTDSGAAPLTSG